MRRAGPAAATMPGVPTAIRRYVRGLGLDAYVVGGAVRDELLGLPHADEDFLVPGVDHAGLRAALEQHGRVEDMEVHGQLVGVRLHPNDREIRALAPGGIDITAPRSERSTGPGHGDFDIVSHPGITIEEDMARRDFTVNALALRLADGALLDPFGGVQDIARRRLRTVSPVSFREDPLRILRGLRFVSQLGFDLSEDAEVQMRLEAPGLATVSAERIGGGITGDGLGELSKLLLGHEPARALLLGRDTGVILHVLPELAPCVGYRLPAGRNPLPLEEHLFAVVQVAADAGTSLDVRLAALLHDMGKPEADATGAHHAGVGARIAGGVLRRLRYPTRTQATVTEIVRGHGFALDGPIDALHARRFLATHGDALAFELLDLKAADLATKRIPPEEKAALATLHELLDGERHSPHRLRDLAVTGDDLQEIGFEEGPVLGHVLRQLLAAVVEDPSRNAREWLLARAAKERP